VVKRVETAGSGGWLRIFLSPMVVEVEELAEANIQIAAEPGFAGNRARIENREI